MKIIGMSLFSAAMLLCIYESFVYLRYVRTKEEKDLKLGAKLHSYLLLSLIGAGVLLFLAIVLHDFSLNYVASYSSTKEEWYYLISTFWAGQEGTFYLWLLYTVFFGFFVTRLNDDFTPYVMVILNLTNFFLLLLLLKQSPFRPLDPEIVSVLQDGRGLNPLLKNPWMVIHPPVLFLGYSSVVVPAAYALAGLWKRDLSGWIRHAFPWALFSSAILGLGVIMGGYWAYVVLGWGGYWAWDPVENASIFPWFIIVACFHAMLIYKSVKGFLKTTIILAIASYFLMLYGSFLTRSGILADFSVHSFSSLGLNGYLISFIISFVLISLYLLVSRWKKIHSEKIEDRFSKDMILAFVVVIFILSTFGIFIGTSLPLFTIFADQQLASSEPAQYNTIFSFVAIFIMLFLSLAPILKWKKVGFNLKKSILILTIIASISLCLPIIIYRTDLLLRYYLVFALAIWAVLINSYNFIRFYKSPPLRNSAVSHVGLALMMFGIMASSTLGEDSRLRLYQNQMLKKNGLELRYLDKLIEADDANTTSYIVEGKFAEDDVFHAKLRFTYSDYSKGTMRKPHIERRLGEDLYFSPVNLTEFPNAERRKLVKGESFEWNDKKISFTGFKVLQMNPQEGIFEIQANFSIEHDGKKLESSAVYTKTNASAHSDIKVLKEADYSFKLLAVNATEKSVEFLYGKADKELILEQLEIELSSKPLIYVLWLGTIILVLGLLMSVKYRASVLV